MATMKIKKDDMVRVIAGKDREKEGKVLAVDPKKNTVVVEGVNMLTKHTKQTAQDNSGGIIHVEGPIDISNVMLLVDGKPTRVAHKMDGDKKVRVCKKCGANL